MADVDGGDLVPELLEGGGDGVDGLLPIELGLGLVVVVGLQVVRERDAHGRAACARGADAVKPDRVKRDDSKAPASSGANVRFGT
ncbi:MAG: hypothetical protein Q8O67_26660 [Deltaproteobacteria bacterium]|nr:hypothetical protein [Deltaproteobacteria bacterium]